MSHKRKDLSEFNWSDDMIERYSFGDDSVLQSVIPPNTEPKQRPVALNNRLDPSSVQSHIIALQKCKEDNTLLDEERDIMMRKGQLERMELSKALNEMSLEWLSLKDSEAILNHIPFLPLYFFNDVDYEIKSNEDIILSKLTEEERKIELGDGSQSYQDLAIPAVGLYIPSSNQDNEDSLTTRELSFGEWRRFYIYLIHVILSSLFFYVVKLYQFFIFFF